MSDAQNAFQGFHVRQVPMTPEEEEKAAIAQTMRQDIAQLVSVESVSFLDRSPIIGAINPLAAPMHVETVTSDDVIVTGDFNIAPLDIDVWDPAALEGSTHVSEPERNVLAELRTWGLVDIFREQHPEPKLYSWWDYRDGSFHKGHGMRIDYLLVSKTVAQRTTETTIDRNARKGEKPSDHAPVLLRF